MLVFGDLVWVKGADDPLIGKKCQHSVRNEEGAWLENSAPDHKPLILEHHSQASDPEIKGTDNDDATRGLHRLTATDFYSDGPNGAGINVVDPILTNLDYCP